MESSAAQSRKGGAGGSSHGTMNHKDLTLFISNLKK